LEPAKGFRTISEIKINNNIKKNLLLRVKSAGAFMVSRILFCCLYFFSELLIVQLLQGDSSAFILFEFAKIRVAGGH